LLQISDPVVFSQAAYLHDLGKTMWPESLFTKYPLEPLDWGLIKAHPLSGENMAVEIWPEVPLMVRALIKGHHERPGGRGYPDGLEEPGIEILLLAACDEFDNMTNERPYMPGRKLPKKDALMEVSRFFPAQAVAALAIAAMETH